MNVTGEAHSKLLVKRDMARCPWQHVIALPAVTGQRPHLPFSGCHLGVWHCTGCFDGFSAASPSKCTDGDAEARESEWHVRCHIARGGQTGFRSSACWLWVCLHCWVEQFTYFFFLNFQDQWYIFFPLIPPPTPINSLCLEKASDTSCFPKTFTQDVFKLLTKLLTVIEDSTSWSF